MVAWSQQIIRICYALYAVCHVIMLWLEHTSPYGVNCDKNV